jgi:hypothetical protein
VSILVSPLAVVHISVGTRYGMTRLVSVTSRTYMY